VGSIPIARSIFRCLASPHVVLGRARAHCLVPTVSMRLQPVFGDQMCTAVWSIPWIASSAELVHRGLLRPPPRLVSRPIKPGVLVFRRRPYPLAKFLDSLGKTTRCSFVFFSCLKFFFAVVYELLSISHL
jgi:hypothetical protein